MALRNEGVLKKLWLDGNNFSANLKSYDFLDYFIVFNNTLEFLSLNSCKLHDDIIEALGRGLHKNIKIRELYLSSNGFGVILKFITFRLKELKKFLRHLE